MSNDAIQAALATRLRTLSPALPFAWPNSAYTPTIGTAFARVGFLPAQTANPTMGAGALDVKRYNGVMQVSLCYPINTGEGDPRRKADAVIALFPRGSTFSYGGVDVHIDYTPSASPGFSQDAWYVLPVSVYYRADII